MSKEVEIKQVVVTEDFIRRDKVDNHTRVFIPEGTKAEIKISNLLGTRVTTEKPCTKNGENNFFLLKGEIRN